MSLAMHSALAALQRYWYNCKQKVTGHAKVVEVPGDRTNNTGQEKEHPKTTNQK